MIIDAHCHVGLEDEGIKERKGCVEWRNFVNELVTGFGFPYPKRITLETLIEAMDAVRVDKAIICGWCYEPLPTPAPVWSVDFHGKGNDYVAECVDKYPDRFVGVMGINPVKEDAVKEVVRCVEDLHLKGIKLWPGNFSPDDKKIAYPIYEKAVEYKIPVQIHMGPEFLPGARLKYLNPLLLDDPAHDFPELQIHHIHFGASMMTREAAIVCSMNKNVSTDTCVFPLLSGDPYQLDIPMLKYAELSFPDRVMYATDYVGVYAGVYSVPVIMSLPLSLEFKNKILGENAARIYNIK